MTRTCDASLTFPLPIFEADRDRNLLRRGAGSSLGLRDRQIVAYLSPREGRGPLSKFLVSVCGSTMRSHREMVHCSKSYDISYLRGIKSLLIKPQQRELQEIALPLAYVFGFKGICSLDF